MTNNWMTALADHYEQTRRDFLQDRLMILFDIDDTILDLRHMIRFLLQRYDQLNQTHFFQNLQLSEITVPEHDIAPLLAQQAIPASQQSKILRWYADHAWSTEAMLEAHRPFAGVLETIRWFQMQPNTVVGLNTARPESLRRDTLRSLNKLGQAYKVTFEDALLYMKPDDWPTDSPAAKVEGIRTFQAQGYRVFAFIDNEPENIQAVAEYDVDDAMLLLHADTIFRSKKTQLTARVVGGKDYDLTELISKETLPQHIQFVWHGINDIANLGQFLRSDVHWGEFRAQSELLNSMYYLQTQAANQTAPRGDTAWLATLDDTLTRVRSRGKGIKINLDVDNQVLETVLERVDRYRFSGEDLWFSGQIELLGAAGFRYLAELYPAAIIETPIDYLAPLMTNAPTKAQHLLDQFQAWGINRFGISWHTPDLRPFFETIAGWGYSVNIYNVPDLEAFLQGVLMLPRSITSDFYFPKWAYYGRRLELAHPNPAESLNRRTIAVTNTHQPALAS